MMVIALGLALVFATVQDLGMPGQWAIFQQSDTETKLTRFRGEFIMFHPDVRDFLVHKGYGTVWKRIGQTDEELIRQYKLDRQVQKEYKDGLTKEIEAELVKRYGLEEPLSRIKQYDQWISVERLGAEISEVHIVTFIATEAEAKIVTIRAGKESSEVKEEEFLVLDQEGMSEP